MQDKQKGAGKGKDKDSDSEHLKKLEDEGLVDLDALSAEQVESLAKILTEKDVNNLTDMNSRLKADASLGPLSAVTRAGPEK